MSKAWETAGDSSKMVRIRPNEYVHVLNLNTNVTNLKMGPETLMLQTHEKLVFGPSPCIIIPPGHYCIVNDPIKKYVEGGFCELYIGQSKVLYHDAKVPYALYPGEWLPGATKFGKDTMDYSGALKPLPVVKANQAIRLEAIQDHQDGTVFRKAGDVWQLEGPLTYKPVPEVKIDTIINATVIKAGEVLRLVALQELVDRTGKKRVAGEKWMIKEQGAYLPNVFEKVECVEPTVTLNHETALYLKAKQTTEDLMGKTRLAGEMWLLTRDDCPLYTSQIGVEILKTVKKTVVRKGQYAVILDPIGPNGKPQLGKKVLKVGRCDFFLHPGESLEKGMVQNSYVLSHEESLVLQALEKFTENVNGEAVERKTGERWLKTGPLNYIPPVHVNIVARRKKYPLSKNEGIYVQDTVTGKVRAILGPTSYMLTATEELWEKELGSEIELLLKQGGGAGSGDIRKVAYFEQSIDPSIVKGRDKTKVVTYRCPSNTAVQVDNYQQKTARVVFGPDLVVLGPQESFNVLSLSAGKPKKSDALKSLCLMLGPDFISDIMEVETSDHARLRLQLSFNNHFEVDKTDPESTAKIFSVPDFIGFVCRQIGSRIRASIALTTFDTFHRHSAQIIQTAAFGAESLKKEDCRLKFDVNNLVISSIDVQSIEPVDVKMRDSLTKSVQLAIEISTNSIEAAASHEASRSEQEAKGQLERQVLLMEKESEKERANLYELRAIASAVESTGQAKAEAQAQAERELIECESEIEGARLRAEAAEIESTTQLDVKDMLRFAELEFRKKMNNIQIQKEKAMSNLEVNRFSQMVGSLGPKTIVAMANAGPENQLNLLKSLGLESVLLTDGNSPINLLNTASGLISDRKQ